MFTFLVYDHTRTHTHAWMDSLKTECLRWLTNSEGIEKWHNIATEIHLIKNTATIPHKKCFLLNTVNDSAVFPVRSTMASWPPMLPVILLLLPVTLLLLLFLLLSFSVTESQVSETTFPNSCSVIIYTLFSLPYRSILYTEWNMVTILSTWQTRPSQSVQRQISFCYWPSSQISSMQRTPANRQPRNLPCTNTAMRHNKITTKRAEILIYDWNLYRQLHWQTVKENVQNINTWHRLSRWFSGLNQWMGYIAFWAEDFLAGRGSNQGLGVFQHNWTSWHAKRWSTWTGMEGPPVSI